MFAGNRSKEDRRRQLGWRGHVESNLEQRQARRVIEEGMTMLVMKFRVTFLCHSGNAGDGREETFICHCIEGEISILINNISQHKS